MRQYFLADLAHEQAMLAMLAADTARFDGLVTYNGRSFDVPFVETRLTLARLPSPYAPLAHFNLLHPVRRLYKHRMPGCRLAEAERRLLKLDRPDDVPGWLIPQLYFDYLRAGRASPLRGVFRHNAEDVLSLVGILASLAKLLSSDDTDADDAVAVARWWERATIPNAPRASTGAHCRGWKVETTGRGRPLAMPRCASAQANGSKQWSCGCDSGRRATVPPASSWRSTWSIMLVTSPPPKRSRAHYWYAQRPSNRLV